MSTELKNKPSSSPDRNLIDGHQKMEFDIGSMHLSVLTIRAESITSEERQKIRNARKSYVKWGGNSSLEEVLEDEFDGFDNRGQNSDYGTYHFIATISGDSSTDIREEDLFPKPAQKIVTMRMVQVLNPNAVPPEDYTIWLIRNNLTGSEVTLDRYIREHPEQFRKRDTPDSYMYPATISRLGTMDGTDVKSYPQRRMMTPIAFAGIQLAAGKVCDSNLIGAQLRPELREDYLSINGSNGEKTVMGFKHTQDTIGLTRDNSMILDNSNPTVQKYKTHFLGYWLNGSQFRHFINKCVSDGTVPTTSLRAAFSLLLEKDSERIERNPELFQLLQTALKGSLSTLTPIEESQLITLITDPRFARHLVPLINSEYVGNLPGQEFQRLMIEESGDGPYPALMEIDQWVSSAENLLQVASGELRKSNA